MLLIPILELLVGLRQWIHHSGLIARLNVVLVKHAYFWFTIVYLGHLFHYTDANGIIPYTKLNPLLVGYALNTVFSILTNFWFFGPSIFERIDVAAGGHCEYLVGGDLGLERSLCERGDNTTWIKGFDISGHYYLLVSISLLVLQMLIDDGSLSIWAHQLDTDEEVVIGDTAGIGDMIDLPPLVAKVDRWLLNLTITLLGCWYVEYLVTSLFFHTIPEKFCGLVVALIVPFVALRFIQSKEESL